MLSWQSSLAHCITDVQTLWEILELDPHAFPNTPEFKNFPLRVPREFVARMQKGNPRDPLLLQALPQAEERKKVARYVKDALQEKNKNPVPGLLHKYQGRVLLTVTGGCAIHCRYCFRRHFPYTDNAPNFQNWKPVLDYIQNDAAIKEVILSGGDPLIVKDAVLEELIHSLEKIPHITTVRIHTRLPIMIPTRITSDLLKIFSTTRLQVVVVAHCNHAQEIDASVKASFKKLCDAKVVLLNQSVLLRGINDTAQALIDLSHALFAAGVLPYYLHLLDLVEGTAHFEVPEAEAKKLMKAISAELPGYLVPKLAREIPGETSKTIIF